MKQMIGWSDREYMAEREEVNDVECEEENDVEYEEEIECVIEEGICY